MDPENNRPHDTPILAAVARQCPGCEEIERVREAIPQKIRGAYVALIPFDEFDEEADAVLGRDAPSEPPTTEVNAP